MQITADEAVNRFLGDISVKLAETYPLADAEALVRDYYAKFTDPSYCIAIGIPVQDDDFFFHEGTLGMALRVHYYLGLAGDPSPNAFIAWRTAVVARRA